MALLFILMSTVAAFAAADETISSDKYVMIDAGNSHTVALKSDGTVWAWGSNRYGQLGNGTFEWETAPKKIEGLSGFIAIDASYSQTVALKSDGTVWSWGLNYTSIADSQNAEKNNRPVQIKGLEDIVEVCAGEFFAAALKSDGTVWTWGDKSYLGINANEKSAELVTAPVKVNGLGSIDHIYCNDRYMLAYEADGTLWIWGEDWRTETYDVLLKPEKLDIPEDTADIAAGGAFIIGLRKDGTLWGMGNNGNGQLGTGNMSGDRNTIVDIDIDNVEFVTAGGLFAIAQKKDGSVWGWGSNYFGQLGRSTAIRNATEPVMIEGLQNTSMVSAGFAHALAFQADGILMAWGRNNGGQLGTVQGTDSDHPLPVAGASAAKAAPSTWAAAEVEKAVEHNLVCPDMLSNYQQKITREEFSRSIVKLYQELTEKTPKLIANPFNDTDSEFAIMANGLGIINGVGNGRFAPDDPITRQDLCVMLFRTLKAAYPDKTFTSEGTALGFKDGSSVSSYAKEAVSYCSSVSIVKGIDGRMDPRGNVTREQAMIMVVRAYLASVGK